MDTTKTIVTDEWEIFPTSITLEDKIGEGAFGTVFSAMIDPKIFDARKKHAKFNNGQQYDVNNITLYTHASGDIIQGTKLSFQKCTLDCEI